MTYKTAQEHRFDNLQAAFRKFVHEKGISKHGAIKAFANHVECSERFIGHLLAERKNIGEKTARKIEKALGLSKGRFDQGNMLNDILKGVKPDEESFLRNALLIYRGSPPAIRKDLSAVLDSISICLPKRKIKVVARKKR